MEDNIDLLLTGKDQRNERTQWEFEKRKKPIMLSVVFLRSVDTWNGLKEVITAVCIYIKYRKN